MTYAKPEVAILGTADEVIKANGKQITNVDGHPGGTPAYDLDE